MEWDIQEVKHLKKKQLVQLNLVMLLLFVLSVYYVHVGWPISAFFGLSCLFLWVFSACTLYPLLTGKMIGTKESKLTQAFDRERWGEKRWKRRKVMEAVLVIIVSAVCTVLVFTMDFGSDTLEFFNLGPFVGAWLGSNIGGFIRINTLE